MTIEKYLNLRTDWEEIVVSFKLPNDRYQGTLDNMKYFIKYGWRSNGMREGCDRAVEIAKEVVKGLK